MLYEYNKTAEITCDKIGQRQRSFDISSDGLFVFTDKYKKYNDISHGCNKGNDKYYHQAYDCRIQAVENIHGSVKIWLTRVELTYKKTLTFLYTQIKAHLLVQNKKDVQRLSRIIGAKIQAVLNYPNPSRILPHISA